MASVPLRFDPYEWEEYLEFSDTAGVTEAKWKALGLSVFYAKPESDPQTGWVRSTPAREDLLRHTPQLFFHGHNGYSLGRHTELFIFPSRHEFLEDDDRPEPFYFKMGAAEGSLGQATPLAHFLFDAGHNEDYDGYFSSFLSLRLGGVTKESAEVVGLSAMLLIGKEHQIELRPMRVGDFEWANETSDPPGDEEKDEAACESEHLPAALAVSSGFSEVEPLRMLLRGRDEPTPEVAFLQLYRVLEYFSILCNEEKVGTMRSDGAMATRAFLLAIQQLVARDERASLGRLLAEIANGKVLAAAKDAGLVDRKTPAALTEALYDFRNSVVHAKEDRGLRLFSASIFAEPSNAVAWRRVCEELAWSALERYGNRT
jgi:hypothetical protein